MDGRSVIYLNGEPYIVVPFPDPEPPQENAVPVEEPTVWKPDFDGDFVKTIKTLFNFGNQHRLT